MLCVGKARPCESNMLGKGKRTAVERRRRQRPRKRKGEWGEAGSKEMVKDGRRSSSQRGNRTKDGSSKEKAKDGSKIKDKDNFREAASSAEGKAIVGSSAELGEYGMWRMSSRRHGLRSRRRWRRSDLIWDG